MTYFFLIAYCTISFGVHGGEGVTGVNRQFRNLLCAVPFGLVFLLFGWKTSALCFILGYGGASLGFNLPGGLYAKGFITCPFGGFIALPLAYYIGYKTRFKNVLAEYLSGTFYGLILSMVVYHVG